MPAGFSAEHLGPNDFYYWDNFWSIAGLKSCAQMCSDMGIQEKVTLWEKTAEDFSKAVEQSLVNSANKRRFEGIPASPYRRMDAGCIGSIIGSYPLKLVGQQDIRTMNTVNYLIGNYFIENAFFHDITHSGFNAYLTLHVAQVLLRAGDRRFYNLVEAVMQLASSTGQWPEAIHPHTKGGCMGDGQHVWAAAEWVIMIRNCFIREEDSGLVIGSGIVEKWLMPKQRIQFGPAPTDYGVIRVDITPSKSKVIVRWELKATEQVPLIKVSLPGLKSISVSDPVINQIEVSRV